MGTQFDRLDGGLARATFAAGCFWGVEAAFRRLDGVVMTSVGYCGGNLANPSYEAVCTGTTGHAEAVQVTFDPERVSYEELLSLFWVCHDPTQLNRQGPDVGSQYRTAIFCHDGGQLAAAEASKQALVDSGQAGGSVVSEIEMLSDYYLAEDYHQQYLEKRGMAVSNLP
ncbi:MAG: peptide-methionine (S)-S-oxide reductase MsrA [Alphaproteobacteria bacterium]|jgi:peptide-methionine (S)-S-oxide reductase|nr:peptide-methionine (S)-S-oxide reductase MsrA [Alphaproteobacteria bacterium]|tara:strand:- start:208 stop:714 length:507 start_codon:yes stop_codon:yes gene_type:complete